MRGPWIVGVVVASLAVAEEAGAGPCDCDHLLALDVTIADGSALGVQPGDSVCVQGGKRPFLRLQKFTGAEGEVIEIRNCEGQVDISNDDKGYALTIERSNFVRLTGTGDDAFMYGFRSRGSRTGPDYAAMSVSIGDLSSDIEVDHVEAYEAGFAGFMVKTDPRCDGSANLGNFVMYNSRLHHNYIHDTGGEGIYFGSTGYGGREYTCDGVKKLLYPHEHHGADIHDNIIEDTDWDGAQIGVTPKGCAFYRNRVQRVGLVKEQYQWQGLQIGGASACEVWGNLFADGPANGVFVLGADDTRVYNNLIVDFGEHGIYANDQELDLQARYGFAFNTIVGSGQGGLTVFGSKLGPGYAYSNAVVGVAAIGIGNEVPGFVQMANQTADTAETLGFVDPASRDFHLLPDSPLRDAGVVPPDLMVSDDRDGTPRDDGAPDVGAHEFSLDPPDPGSTGADDTGSPGDTGSAEGTDDTGDAGGETAPGESGADTASDSGESAAPTGSGPTGDATGSTSEGGGSSSDTAGAAGGEGCDCRGSAPGAGTWALGLLLLLRRRRP